MFNQIADYKREVTTELYKILHFWQQYTVDTGSGGFYGALNNENEVLEGAPKGAVLNSRILWTFSAAYNFDHHPEWLEMADRAYHYLQAYFRDQEYGGVYWSVTAEGQPLETRKQVYGQAFMIYALSEYYRCNPREEVLDWAMGLYRLLEAHSYDPLNGGYFEAFSREWGPIADLRLSAKDDNASKTMNTHLHVLEAYTNLYRIWPDTGLRKRLYHLLDIFTTRIISPATHQQVLFFDNEWQRQSKVISFGHDIEAAWLLQEAAEVLQDAALIKQVKDNAVRMAAAAINGVDGDGGMRYEDHIAEKHWWVQAEAMVGFFNAWQNSGEEKYLQLSMGTWAFVKQYIIDKQKGEWYWGITAQHEVMPGQDKAGFWKCPYHNSRACLEIIHRIV